MPFHQKRPAKTRGCVLCFMPKLVQEIGLHYLCKRTRLSIFKVIMLKPGCFKTFGIPYSTLSKINTLTHVRIYEHSPSLSNAEYCKLQ